MQRKLILLWALVIAAMAAYPALASTNSHLATLTSHSPNGPTPMPGMDMPGTKTPETNMPETEVHLDMPGMDHGSTPQDRPLKPVLGVFGVATSAVLLGAGLLRRQDRIRDKAKQAKLTSRRSQR